MWEMSHRANALSIVVCGRQLCERMNGCRSNQAAWPWPVVVAPTLDQLDADREPSVRRQLVSAWLRLATFRSVHYLGVDLYDFHHATKPAEVFNVAGVKG